MFPSEDKIFSQKIIFRSHVASLSFFVFMAPKVGHKNAKACRYIAGIKNIFVPRQSGLLAVFRRRLYD